MTLNVEWVSFFRADNEPLCQHSVNSISRLAARKCMIFDHDEVPV